MLPRGFLRLCNLRKSWVVTNHRSISSAIISSANSIPAITSKSPNFGRLAQVGANSLLYNGVRTFSGMPFRRRQQESGFSDTPQSLQDMFLDLDMNVRRNGRLYSNQFFSLLSAIRKMYETGSDKLTINQLLFLIRSCGELLSETPPSRRRELTKELWEKYIVNEKIDISHYNALLKAHNENEENFNPDDILAELANRGLQPNRVTYQRILDRHCRGGDIEAASKILEIMKEHSMPINENVFNSLILGYGRAGDLESAHGTIQVMRSAGLEPLSTTYATLASAYAEAGQVDKVQQVIGEAKQEEIQLNNLDILSIVKSMAKSGQEDSIDAVLEQLPKGFGYNSDAVRVIQDLINEHQLDAAIRIFRTMEPASEAMQASGSGGLFFVRQMVRANVGPEQMFETCQRLEQEGLLSANYLKIVLEEALSSGNAEISRSLLSQLVQNEPLKSHYFWPLIVRATSLEDLKRVVLQDMTMMKQAAYSPQHETFRDWIWPKVPRESVFDFMAECKDVGYTYSLMLSSYVEYLLANNEIAFAAEVASRDDYSNVRLVGGLLSRSLMEAYVASQNTKATAVILGEICKRSELTDPPTDWCGRFLISIMAYVKEDPIAQLKPLIPVLKANGIQTLNATIEEIKERHQLNRSAVDLLSSIATDQLEIPEDEESVPTTGRTLYRDMSIEELDAKLVDVRDGSREQLTIFRQLFIKLCIRARRTDIEQEEKDALSKRIDELKNKLIEQETFGPAMTARLILTYATEGNIDGALEEYKTKITPDFVLGSKDTIDLANSLIKASRMGEAMEIINNEIQKMQRRSASGPGEDDDGLDSMVNVSVNRRNIDLSVYRLTSSILETLANETNAIEKAKSFIDKVQDLTGLKPVSQWYSPIIRHLLSQGNTEKVLEEFDTLLATHKIMVAKQELMKDFVEKSDAKSLQRIIDASTTQYGELSTLLDLMSACIETGKLKQARKVLNTPGMRAMNARLDNYADRYVNQRQEEHLLNLIQVTRDLFDVDRDMLYYHLIRLYAAEGDSQKALNAWTTMQEADIQPSEKTLRLLADVLKKGGIDVPFAIPEKQRSNPARAGPARGAGRFSGYKAQFDQAIRDGDLEGAIRAKESLDQAGEGLSMSQHSLLLDALTKANRLAESFKLANSLLQEKYYPNPRVLRFLMSKLGAAGEVDMLNQISSHLPTTLKNGALSGYTAHAYANAGRAEEFVRDVLPTMEPAPIGGLLGVLHACPDVEQQVKDFAMENIKSGKSHLPLNMVWLYYMQKGRYQEAEQLFAANETIRQRAIFSDLVKTIREDNNIELAQSLVNQLKSSSMVPRAVAIGYGALIDVLIDNGKISEAEDFLLSHVGLDEEAAQKLSPSVSLNDLNRRILVRLGNGIKTTLNREPTFTVPEPTTVTGRSGGQRDADGAEPPVDDSNIIEHEHVNVKTY